MTDSNLLDAVIATHVRGDHASLSTNPFFTGAPIDATPRRGTRA